MPTVQCDGVVIKSGDFIICNVIGIFIIPLEDIDEVIKLAGAAEEKDTVRKWRFKSNGNILEKNGTNKIIANMNISYE